VVSSIKVVGIDLPRVAGFGYTFFNEKLRDNSFPIGYDEFSGAFHDIVSQPLVNQPGEAWEYGVRTTLTREDALLRF
jgi:hypothetical protein